MCTAASISSRPLATGRGIPIPCPPGAGSSSGRGREGLGAYGASHSLRPLDVEFMRALHQRVNIVPVLAKADTLTPTEVERMKNKVRSCPRLSPHLLLPLSCGSSNPPTGLCAEHSPCS